jgi:RNA polymerase primary sigma factor
MRFIGKFLYEEELSAYFKSIQNIPLLSREEEEALIQRVKEGDKEALNKIILANLRFVIMIAKEYRGYGVPFADLISAGNVGLMEAAKKFDPSKGVKFISYAVWWIRQSIMETIWYESEIIKKPNKMYANASKIENTYSCLKETLGREPSIDDIVSFLNEQGVEIKKREVERYFLSKSIFLSLDTSTSMEDDALKLEGLISIFGTEDIERDLYEEELRNIIKSLLDKLTQRERDILVFRFGLDGNEPKTLDEIGKILGISRERVRQIEKKALKRLGYMMRKKRFF